MRSDGQCWDVGQKCPECNGFYIFDGKSGLSTGHWQPVLDPISCTAGTMASHDFRRRKFRIWTSLGARPCA